MYQKKQIDAYRAISAPDSLREKVLSLDAAAPAPRRRAKRLPLAAMAACLLLMAATLLYGLGGARPMQFSLDGQTLTAESMPLPADFGGVARASNMPRGGVTVPLTLDTAAKTALHVTAGRLEETAADGGVLQSGTELTVTGETALFWRVDTPEDSARFTLTAESARETRTLTLAYDAEAGWTVSCP